MAQESELRHKVVWTIANTEVEDPILLSKFRDDDVAEIANRVVGQANCTQRFSQAYFWLKEHRSRIDFDSLVERLNDVHQRGAWYTAELNFLLHHFGPDEILIELTGNQAMYAAAGILDYETQAEIAFLALTGREHSSPAADSAFVQVLRSILNAESIGSTFLLFLDIQSHRTVVPGREVWPKCVPLMQQLIARITKAHGKAADGLKKWFDSLDQRYRSKARRTKR